MAIVAELGPTRYRYGERAADDGRYCQCSYCAAIVRCTGTGALPAGWDDADDCRLNFVVRAKRALGQPVPYAWTLAWGYLCNAVAAHYDRQEPDYLAGPRQCEPPEDDWQGQGVMQDAS